MIEAVAFQTRPETSVTQFVARAFITNGEPFNIYLRDPSRVFDSAQAVTLMFERMSVSTAVTIATAQIRINFLKKSDNGQVHVNGFRLTALLTVTSYMCLIHSNAI